MTQDEIKKWAKTRLPKPPDPYSESELEHNQKPRTVWCFKCGYKLITDIPGPICSKCNGYMITR